MCVYDGHICGTVTDSRILGHLTGNFEGLIDRSVIRPSLDDDINNPFQHSPKVGELPRQNACDLLPVAGPCKGRMVRYFFNSANKQCQQFVYGGCQGNDNNFGSQEACERACSAGKIW